MKKILSILVISLLLLSCCMFVSTAGEIPFGETNMYICSGEPISFSENFTELYCDSKEYVRFNDNYIFSNEEFEVINTITLSDTQKILVKEIYLSATPQGNIVWASIEYHDGAYLSVSFLAREYIDIYNDAMTEKWETANVSEYIYGEGTLFTVNRSQLFGKKTIVKEAYYDNDIDFNVNIEPQNCDFSIQKGEILKFDESFYYLDYMESNINPDDSFDDMEMFEAYEIVDEKLISELEKFAEEYYDSGLGFMEDDSFLKSGSDAFTVIIFGILPFAVLVLFIILMFKAHGVYKKLFAAISATALGELIIFGIVILYYVINK